MAAELDKSVPEALRLISDFKHIGYEYVTKTVPRITSSSSLKTRGAAAPRIYSNYLAASLGFDILLLILTIEDA